MKEIKIKNLDVVKIKVGDKLQLGEVHGYSVDLNEEKLYNINCSGTIVPNVKKSDIVARYTEFKSRPRKAVTVSQDNDEIPELPETEVGE